MVLSMGVGVVVVSLDGGQLIQAVAQPLCGVAQGGGALESLGIPQGSEQRQPHHDSQGSSSEDGSRQALGGFHGSSVVDSISLQAGVGAAVPPVCHLSDCHRLAGGRLAIPSKLPSLPTLADRLAPVAALGLGAMHQQGERCSLETVAVVVINNQTSSVSICFCHEHFAIASEHTFIDQVVELATIACRHVEVRGQLQTNKQWQILAVAVELQIRIVHSNHNPRLKVSCVEEVPRLMNSDEFSRLFASFLQFSVDKISTIARLESFNNCFKVVLAVVENCIILHLGGCSEATKLGVLTINNRTLAVLICNCHREALQSTRAGRTCRQAENQGAFVKLSVTLGEVKHGSVWWWEAVLPPVEHSMAPPEGSGVSWWTVPQLAQGQKSTLQSVSFFTATQKKYLPLVERRNTRFSLICSTIHSGLLFIMLANLFFAFLDLGVTNARSNMMQTHRT